VSIIVQQVINGITLGMMYALLALGFTMVYGIMGLINFAHFNIFMVGAFAGLLVLQAFGVHDGQVLSAGAMIGIFLVALCAVMAFTGFLGIVIERISLRPMRGVPGTGPMIATIGINFILLNIVLLATSGQPSAVPGLVPDTAWNGGGIRVTVKQVLVWAIALALMGALHLMVQRSRLGKAMRATATDSEAARLMGIDVDRIILFTFFFGSALAGAVGLIFALYYGQIDFEIGYLPGLRAFTAAVFGGIGNIKGAMVGGLAIGLIESLGGEAVGVGWSDAVIFAILVAVLVFRPTGLLGSIQAQRA
jgi:branched-chain amino acid transport system permease protein